MKRREFIGVSLAVTGGIGSFAWAQGAKPADAKKGITEKDILREGQPATIPNYCEHPEKQPNKFCPTWPTNKGYCDTCMFYNKDNSETTFKGAKYARCQLLGDPTKPQFVGVKAYCSTYAKKP